MACALRSLSRRNLSSKWFCKTSSSCPLVLHHVKDYTEPSLPDLSLPFRRFHRQVFFEDRTRISFAQPLGSGVFLCRHISSSSSCKLEESCTKIDGFGNVAEELTLEKSVEAMPIDGCSAALENLYSPEECVQYVINGIHELTGFNWWISIVLTAFLVNGLMAPLLLRMQIRAWEIRIYQRGIQKVKRVIQSSCSDPKKWEGLVKYRKLEEKWTEKLEDRFLSIMPLVLLHMFITTIFIEGISDMAKKIPGFENGGIFWFTDLTTPDGFYILPLLTGLTFWLTEITPISRTNILSKMTELPLHAIIFIAVQAIFEIKPALYLYIIASRISMYKLYRMCRSKQLAKLRKTIGLPDVPVTASEQQRIMARLISVMREFIDVVKKKDKN